ncbi:7081_t:CDS:1, partial [Racocetra fulgida]
MNISLPLLLIYFKFVFIILAAGQSLPNARYFQKSVLVNDKWYILDYNLDRGSQSDS